MNIQSFSILIYMACKIIYNIIILNLKIIKNICKLFYYLLIFRILYVGSSVSATPSTADVCFAGVRFYHFFGVNIFII